MGKKTAATTATIEKLIKIKSHWILPIMLQLKSEERVLLQKKANVRFLGSKKAVGTLFITNLRLLFFPLLHKRKVEIYLDCIKTVELLKGWFKKIKIITEKKRVRDICQGGRKHHKSNRNNHAVETFKIHILLRFLINVIHNR